MILDLHSPTPSLVRILNCLDIALFTLNAQGEFASSSDGLERMCGLPAEEVVGRPHVLLDTDASFTLETLWRRVRAGEPSARGVLTLRHGNGHELHVLADLQRLEEGGALVGAAGVFTDFTLYMQAQSRQAVRKEPARIREDYQRMVGESLAMRTVSRRLEQAARIEVSVLIRGETGTGKELAAQAIHTLSSRRGGPLVCVNCSAIPDPLMESELFGHVKGAFTGAIRNKRGVFESAQGGVLFLDEIGDLGASVQAKLLRVLEEREIRRVGGEETVPVDVRIVTATHRDLAAMVAAGQFREDLYYRLRVFELMMPPIREREGDLPLLIDLFVQQFSKKHRKPVVGLTEAAMACTERYAWPGNVRELRNALEHAFVTVEGARITTEDLPREVRGSQAGPVALERSSDASPAEVERTRIEAALQEARGRKGLAASLLGMSRVTLWKKIKKHGINPIYLGRPTQG